jgi:hypothetical protein
MEAPLEKNQRIARQTNPRLLRNRHRNRLESSQRKHSATKRINPKNAKRSRKVKVYALRQPVMRGKLCPVEKF